MEKTELILADDFCVHHSVSYSFITHLHDAGLVEVVHIEEKQYLHPDCVEDIEKLARLHNDLGINMEGLEAISHLLQQMREMRNEIKQLTQRLYLYESGS